MNRTARETILREGDATCFVIRGVFEREAFEAWHAHIPWQQNAITVYGKEHLEPRLTAWMGPAYAYSSIRWPKRPLTQEVLELRDAVQGFCDAAPVLNACLFNLYRNGVDSMGWHRDNEPEIDPACIASVSFGATRDFAIRHRQTKEKWMVSLGHGDLLVMENMQRDFDHALPKRLKVHEPRINLTFRALRD